MRAVFISLSLLICSINSNSLEFGTNLYTNHLLAESYFDKKTGSRKRYNESIRMMSLWFDFKYEGLSQDTKVKWGAGRFTNSFGERGNLVGARYEPRIDKHADPLLGDYETYYSLGAVMTNTYRKLAYKPISLTSVGVRNNSGSMSLGSYGIGAVVVINLTINLMP